MKKWAKQWVFLHAQCMKKSSIHLQKFLNFWYQNGEIGSKKWIFFKIRLSGFIQNGFIHLANPAFQYICFLLLSFLISSCINFPVDGQKMGDEVAYTGKIDPAATSVRLYDLKAKTQYRITVRGLCGVIGHRNQLQL